MNRKRYISNTNELEQKLYSPIYYLENIPQVIWKPINLEIYPNIIPNTYYVNNYGQIYSSARNIFVSYEISNKGYYRANLIRNDNRTKAMHAGVNRIVLGTFNPVPNMNNLEVNHKDGCKLNNNLSNLEWVTYSGNAQHAIRNGLIHWRIGDECSWSMINSEQADRIGLLLTTTEYSYKEIGDIVGCSKAIVANIASGISWRDVYYKYNLRKSVVRKKSNFTLEQLNLIKNYIETNIHKYLDLDKRYLCIDMMKDLFDIILNRSIYVELMDIIDEYLENYNNS